MKDQRDGNELIGYTVTGEGGSLCDSDGSCNVYDTSEMADEKRRQFFSKGKVEPAYFWHILTVMLTGSYYLLYPKALVRWNAAVKANADRLKRFEGLNLPIIPENTGCAVRIGLRGLPLVFREAMAEALRTME